MTNTKKDKKARELAKEGFKECKWCEIVQPVGEFYKRNNRPNGYLTGCKTCRAEKNPSTEESRDYHYKRKYGITLETYELMLRAQDYTCAICGTAAVKSRNKKLVVDHCHDTGKVRGLLCNKCNVGLGQFGDNKEVLLKALAYLDD